jgi:molybdate transport system permease protein
LFTPDPISAIRLSLVVGLWCVVLGLPFAVAGGWLLARREFAGKTAVSTLLLAPLVIPPVVTGLLILSVLGASSPLGRVLEGAGLPIAFTLTGGVLAALAVGLPLYVLAARAAFEAVDPRLEEVSLTLGVPPAKTFRRITLPLALPGIAAGAVLAFARALGEFGATAVVSGNVEGETRTIAMAVYTLLESPSGGSATFVLVLASLVLSFAALAGYELLTRWQRRRLEVSRVH